MLIPTLYTCLTYWPDQAKHGAWEARVYEDHAVMIQELVELQDDGRTVRVTRMSPDGLGEDITQSVADELAKLCDGEDTVHPLAIAFGDAREGCDPVTWGHVNDPVSRLLGRMPA